MVKTAISLYSVRALDEPLFDTLDRVVEAGYDGVQFAGGFGGASLGAVADYLADHGLESVGPHVEIERLETELDDVADEYRDVLGCESVVVPYLGPEAFETRNAVDATIERLNTLTATFDERDWPLHYHNHAHEFVTIGNGEPAFDRVLAATDIGLEPDVGWLLVGGVDPAAFIETYGDRIDFVHMKDMAVESEAFREIGTGDVELQDCADAARDADASWLIYEHDEPTDPVASIAAGAEFLDDL